MADTVNNEEILEATEEPLSEEELKEFEKFQEEHSLISKAKREIECVMNIICKECGDSEEDKYDICYNKNIYDDALKMLEFYCKEIAPSGYAHSKIMPIFNKLANGEPLTPLTGNDEEWDARMSYENNDGSKVYQNKRCSAVFKKVHKDGTVTYSYNDYILKQEIEHLGANWSGWIPNEVLECIPDHEITMPFNPTGNRFIIYTSTYVADENGKYSIVPGEYNTIVYLYAHDRKTNKNYPIFKLFREVEQENGKNDMVEFPYCRTNAIRPCRYGNGFTYCTGNCEKCNRDNDSSNLIRSIYNEANENGYGDKYLKIYDTVLKLYKKKEFNDMIDEAVAYTEKS